MLGRLQDSIPPINGSRIAHRNPFFCIFSGIVLIQLSIHVLRHGSPPAVLFWTPTEFSTCNPIIMNITFTKEAIWIVLLHSSLALRPRYHKFVASKMFVRMPNIFHFPIILLVCSASSKVGAAAFSYGTDMKISRVGEETVLLFSLDDGPFECKYLDYSDVKHVNMVKGAAIVHFSLTQSILLELEMVWYPHCSLPTCSSSMERINIALAMVLPCFVDAMTEILLGYSTIYNTLMENGPALLLSVLLCTYLNLMLYAIVNIAALMEQSIWQAMDAVYEHH